MSVRFTVIAGLLFLVVHLVAFRGAAEQSRPSEGKTFFRQAAEIETVVPVSDQRGRTTRKRIRLAGQAVAVFDADGDGYQDLAFVNGKSFYAVAMSSVVSGNDPVFDVMIHPIGVEDDGLRSEPKSIHSHDYNNDGLMDLYLCNHGKGTLQAKDPGNPESFLHPEKLREWGLYRDARYRTQMSLGNGLFEYSDVGGDGDGDTRGALFADFDGDGNFDLYLSNSPYYGIWHYASSTPNLLLPGVAPGRFGKDILDRAVTNARPGFFKDRLGRAVIGFKGAVTRDFDGDGKPDIVACAFADPEGDPSGASADLDRDGIADGGHQGEWPSGTLVLHNTSEPGKISFRDVSDAAIDNAVGSSSPMKAHSAIPADIDGDGDLDLLLGAGRFNDGTGVARVYRNDSTPGKIRFTNFTTEAGLDFLLDINRLPAPFGPTGGKDKGKKPLMPRLHAGVAADIDNDGDMDWVTCNRVPFHSSHRPSAMIVFENDGKGRFSVIPAARHGLNTTARDMSYGDFNNDGRIDLVTVSGDGSRNNFQFHNQNLVFLNEVENENGYIEIDVTRKSNRLGIGTGITVLEAGTERIIGHDEVRTDFAYRSARPPRLHFGVGKVKSVDIRFRCRDGKTGTRRGVGVNRIYRLDLDED